MDSYPKRDREDVTNEGRNNHGRQKERKSCETQWQMNRLA